MPDELEKFEAELGRISPAAAPAELTARLRAARRKPDRRPARPGRAWWVHWVAGWRGAMLTAPAAAVLVIAWLIFLPAAGPEKAQASDSTGINANAVQVDHALVSSFDTVEKLPDGEPVRFRCRVWQDKVVIRDDAHGVVISQSMPRIVVVPVQVETE